MNIAVDISHTLLRTERLTLRPWARADLDDFFAYASVDGVGQMAGWAPHADKDASRKILDLFIAGKRTFALVREGRAVGSLGIEKYNEDALPEFADLRCCAIGYVLAKDCWGQGLMPEALGEVIRYLFEEQGLDALLCGHFRRNARSARVKEKCGFSPYKTFSLKSQLGKKELVCYGLLRREDWLARRGGAGS